MTTNEMSDLVRANIDKTVRITYSNGEVDLAIVLTVDDEGFVYDLASSPTGERFLDTVLGDRGNRTRASVMKPNARLFHCWRGSSGGAGSGVAAIFSKRRGIVGALKLLLKG